MTVRAELVIPYSIRRLRDLIRDVTGVTSRELDSKGHIEYFQDYFDHLDAKTIVVERDYVDRDFAEDYAGYYSRCFSDYQRKCTRLHFFSKSFDDNDFCSIIGSSTEIRKVTQLQRGYLGFVVLKPLPRTYIGRTCLRTYPQGRSGRCYPIRRPYAVNLYGIPLTVCTLGFQEQDQVTGACATSTLWSVFQGTGSIFQHGMPSPIEITKLATEVVSESVPRHLPNKGLVANQMIHAIHKLGLEVAHYRVEDAYVLRAYVSAYLRAQIPMVLIVDLFDHSPRVNRLLGRHAVAVTGYRIGNKLPTQRFENFVHSSSRITKIFAHDDQIGPFARMEFDEAHAGFPVLLRTSWTSESDGDRGSVSAIPKLLLIPLYHKIRIPYESVEEIVVDFNYVFRQRIRFLDRPLEWDIFLTTVNDFKERVRTTHYLTSQYRRVVLQEPMPHYLWIAMGKKVGGSPVIELVFDATDIEQGKLFLRAVEYDLNIYNLLDLDPSMTLSSRLRTHGGVLARMRGFEQSQLRHILRWFARQAT